MRAVLLVVAVLACAALASATAPSLPRVPVDEEMQRAEYAVSGDGYTSGKHSCWKFQKLDVPSTECRERRMCLKHTTVDREIPNCLKRGPRQCTKKCDSPCKKFSMTVVPQKKCAMVTEQHKTCVKVCVHKDEHGKCTHHEDHCHFTEGQKVKKCTKTGKMIKKKTCLEHKEHCRRHCFHKCLAHGAPISKKIRKCTEWHQLAHICKQTSWKKVHVKCPPDHAYIKKFAEAIQKRDAAKVALKGTSSFTAYKEAQAAMHKTSEYESYAKHAVEAKCWYWRYNAEVKHNHAAAYYVKQFGCLKFWAQTTVPTKTDSTPTPMRPTPTTPPKLSNHNSTSGSNSTAPVGANLQQALERLVPSLPSNRND